MRPSFQHIQAQRATFKEEHWEQMLPLLEARNRKKKRRRIIFWILFGTIATISALWIAYPMISAKHELHADTNALPTSGQSTTKVEQAQTITEQPPSTSEQAVPSVEDVANVTTAPVLTADAESTKNLQDHEMSDTPLSPVSRAAQSDRQESNSDDLPQKGHTSMSRKIMNSSFSGDVAASDKADPFVAVNKGRGITHDPTNTAQPIDIHSNEISGQETFLHTANRDAKTSPATLIDGLGLTLLKTDGDKAEDNNDGIVFNNIDLSKTRRNSSKLHYVAGWDQALQQQSVHGPYVGLRYVMPLGQKNWSWYVQPTIHHHRGDFSLSHDRDLQKFNTIVANILHNSYEIDHFFSTRLSVGAFRSFGRWSVGGRLLAGYLFQLKGYEHTFGYTARINEANLLNAVEDLERLEPVHSSKEYDHISNDFVQPIHFGLGVHAGYKLSPNWSIHVNADVLPSGMGRFQSSRINASTSSLTGDRPLYQGSVQISYRL